MSYNSNGIDPNKVLTTDPAKNHWENFYKTSAVKWGYLIECVSFAHYALLDLE